MHVSTIEMSILAVPLFNTCLNKILRLHLLQHSDYTTRLMNTLFLFELNGKCVSSNNLYLRNSLVFPH